MSGPVPAYAGVGCAAVNAFAMNGGFDWWQVLAPGFPSMQVPPPLVSTGHASGIVFDVPADPVFEIVDCDALDIAPEAN